MTATFAKRVTLFVVNSSPKFHPNVDENQEVFLIEISCSGASNIQRRQELGQRQVSRAVRSCTLSLHILCMGIRVPDKFEMQKLQRLPCHWWIFGRTIVGRQVFPFHGIRIFMTESPFGKFCCFHSPLFGNYWQTLCRQNEKFAWTGRGTWKINECQVIPRGSKNLQVQIMTIQKDARQRELMSRKWNS